MLGELSCAHVTCRPDIGYAVITLSKFSTCPADVHFLMLQRHHALCSDPIIICIHMKTFDFYDIYSSQPLTLPRPLGLVYVRLRLMTSQVTDVR